MNTRNYLAMCKEMSDVNRIVNDTKKNTWNNLTMCK